MGRWLFLWLKGYLVLGGMLLSLMVAVGAFFLTEAIPFLHAAGVEYISLVPMI